MKKKEAKWVVILLVLVLIAAVVDIAVRLSVLAKPKQPSRCLAIPIRFLMEYPNCTNKLIQAANLTNIHIVPPGTLEARRRNLSTLRTK
jgi:hypothetical protein